jgi:diacylglycerol kinase (ATP)
LTRLLLLVNPRSGTGEAETVIEELRRFGAEVATAPIEEADEASVAAVERLAVAGGDGSIGPAAAAAAAAGLPLAVVPTGTANDFARALGLPLGLHDACRLAATGSRRRALELGWMDGRPFVNVASAGLPPVAAAAARSWKRSLGPLAYVLGAAWAALRADPVDCRVICDEEELFAGLAWQATVACSGAFGAGASIGGEPSDGRLDALVIAAGSRPGLVRVGYGLRAGTIRSQPGISARRALRVRIEVSPGTSFNLDGELCAGGPVEFTVEPRAFELLVS